MKKAASLISGLGFLSFATRAFAQAAAPVDINISNPGKGVSPTADVGKVLSQLIGIIFVVAIIIVLFMLVFGAFQWITSGGEKEGVDHARKRITAALIGLAILAFSFLFVRVVGSVLNINLLQLQLPVLGS